jgi:hypothetical protein
MCVDLAYGVGMNPRPQAEKRERNGKKRAKG